MDEINKCKDKLKVVLERNKSDLFTEISPLIR